MKKNLYLILIAISIFFLGLYFTRNNPNEFQHEKKPQLLISKDKTTSDNDKKHESINKVNETSIIEKGDREVAVYNNIVVKKSEVNSILRKLFEGKFPENKNDFDDLDDNMKENILKGLIASKLLEDEARKSQIEQSDKFKEQMEELSKRLMNKVYIDNKIKSYITDKLLEEKYKEFVDKWGDKEEFKARHILVSTEDEAKQVIKDIESGISFEDEAKSKSSDPSKDRGGDLGYFSKGQMVKEFENAINELTIGKISMPVKTAFGWHIIKLEDVRKIPAPLFDEVKPRLEAELSMKFVQDYNDQLLKNNKIELFIKNNSENVHSKENNIETKNSGSNEDLKKSETGSFDNFETDNE